MAHVEHFPWQPEPTGTEVGGGKKPRFSRNTRRVVGGGLAATLTLTLAGGAAVLLNRKHGPEDGTSSGGTGGGALPAVVVSGATPTPVESAVNSTPAPTEKYDDSYDVACEPEVVLNGSKMHIIPHVTVNRGKPDPSRFVTVVDMLSGSDPSKFDSQKTYAAAGLGAAVDVQIPDRLDWRTDSAPVSIMFYPGDRQIPDDPNQLSMSSGDADRVGIPCGNAVITFLIANGGVNVNGG